MAAFPPMLARTEDPEADLRRKRTLVNAFLENVPDAVYFKDRQFRFIAVSKSKAARHGFANPADLVGKSDADLFAGAHVANAREDEAAIMATGVPLLGKVEKLNWTDGHVTWARTTKLPLRDEAGRIVGTFGISEDITAAKATEESLEKANKDLIDASRLAGMAEVATGVLHNVGNVLNSLNVSASVIAGGLRQSKVEPLARVAAMLHVHGGDLASYLCEDPKGKLVPEFLRSLSIHLSEERTRLLHEVDSLQRNVEHIKEIVSMQQAYATMIGVVEDLAPVDLLEDSLRMNAAALVRHDVRVVRDFAPAPAIRAERGKVLQILINLIRNAKYAVDSGPAAEKILTLRIAPHPAGRVTIVVEDNGSGIAPENLGRIFSRGFTTRADGHGFGLNSSALAAKEMGGSLTAASAGLGGGAAFTLELPAAATADLAPAPAHLVGADQRP
jgi:PAS domain S-box-containing protein